MSRIANGIRAKRFRVREGANVQLKLETELGEKVVLKVSNSSITGVGAWMAEGDATRVKLECGKVIPESKVVWEDNEVSLGRLVLRSQTKKDEGYVFGFSCVDSKVPLMGSLSKHFESLSNSDETALDFELSSNKFNLASFMESDHTHADIFHKCHEYQLLREDSEKNPMWQFYAVRHAVSGHRVKISLPRIRKPTEYVTFGSYDYFGFSTDPEVREAAKAAIDKFGISASAAPPLSGVTSIHQELEAKIASMLRKEDAILFNSGFSTNVGTLTAILGANDLALSDINCHASIADGLAASKAKVRLFRHNNNKHLETQIKENREAHAGALVVTEGLFSMDGDVPNLQDLTKIAKKYNARILLDEAHSFGILGPTGLGAAERQGVLDDVDIYTGSLSKGPGAGGGFVAGNKEFINWLRSFSRACVFSVAIPPFQVAAALKSLEILQNRPEKREKLLANIRQFHEGLRGIGYTVKSDLESPIVPIIVGDKKKLGEMNKILLEFGIFVNTIVFPAVPENAARFRFTISASHTPSDIQLALVALKRAAEVAEIDFNDMEKAA